MTAVNVGGHNGGRRRADRRDGPRTPTGLLGAFAVTRVAASLLYGVSATDPAIFVTVSTILTLVGLLASVVPVWRALRVDLIRSLRFE